MFYQDLFNCLFAWARSRRWRRMIWLATIPASLFFVALGLIVYGALLSRQTLGSRYLTLVQADVEISLHELQGHSLVDDGEVEPAASGKGAAVGERNKDKSATTITAQQSLQVPLRRIMQLGNFNERVAFIVGNQLARQGRLAMAARMMREIAPLKGGFPPAHAWLANYNMATWQDTPEQRQLLLKDLELADKGGANLSETQILFYKELLRRADRAQEALNLLSDYKSKYPDLRLPWRQLADELGTQKAEIVADLEQERESFQAKQKAGTLTVEDYRSIIQLELGDKAIDQALEYASQGYQSAPSNPDMIRIYSSVLIFKQQLLVEQALENADKSDPNAMPKAFLSDLQYLEEACRVDSSNPMVVEEIAKAIAIGQDLPAELKQALERSLVDGTASGITHLLLANSKLSGETPQAALPHLRLAYQQMPNAPVVMNNLAYAIMKYEPDKLSEAKELMEKALSLPSGSLAERASMLDTLGEIRLEMGDDLGAIELFEEAIRHDGSKLNTRKKLADVYRKIGMTDLADAQLKRIEELRQVP